jgi:hypothetical protein
VASNTINGRQRRLEVGRNRQVENRALELSNLSFSGLGLNVRSRCIDSRVHDGTPGAVTHGRRMAWPAVFAFHSLTTCTSNNALSQTVSIPRLTIPLWPKDAVTGSFPISHLMAAVEIFRDSGEPVSSLKSFGKPDQPPARIRLDHIGPHEALLTVYRSDRVDGTRGGAPRRTATW